MIRKNISNMPVGEMPALGARLNPHAQELFISAYVCADMQAFVYINKV